MVERTDGQSLIIEAKKIPEWLNGNEVAVRLLVQASRASESSDLNAKLIGVASEYSIAPLEVQKPTPKPTAKKPRAQGVKASRSKQWNLPASEVLPIYSAFIQKRNKRLSTAEADRIAQSIIGFSLKYGVDARLIMAMVMVESGFNPNATSRAGAMGLGQLMPGTARGMGVSNAYDSVDNLYGTVRLVRGHLNKYKKQTGDDFQSLVLALAAYNAGGGAVKKHGGVPPYRETQNYVVKVIGLYRQFAGGR
jgi:soluble lytic murein transglycosylase-like protein